MANSILYPVSARQRNISPYALQLRPDFRSPGAFITDKAIGQIREKRGSLMGISDRGVLVEGKTEAWPHIFVRGSSNLALVVYKIFVSNVELSELSSYFDLPFSVLEGSFFRRDCPTVGRIGKEISVRPSWTELLDPEWRNAFLAWIVRKGAIPNPSEFAWQTFIPGHLTFPALPLHAKFKWVERNGKGEYILWEINARPYAFFHYGNHEARYLLGLDKVRHVHRPFEERDTYDRNLFLELLGPKPGRKTYSFTITAGRDGLVLGNVRGEKFLIKSASSEISLKIGERFYLEIAREGSILKFICRKSKESPVYGKADVELNENGYFDSDRVFLDKK